MLFHPAEFSSLELTSGHMRSPSGNGKTTLLDPRQAPRLIHPYAVRVRGGERRLPRFQFSEEGAISGMEEVMREVPKGAHPVALQNFFLSPNPDLRLDAEEEVSISPRDWLLSGGNPEALVCLAREFF